MKILIVDDEEKITTGIWEILSANLPFTCKIVTCNDSVEALSVARNMRPDLLITDVVMPSLSGLELISHCMNLPKPPACIVLSGYEQFLYVQTALRQGAIDYLLKPVDASALIERCIEVHDRLLKTSKDSESVQLPDLPFFSQKLQTETYPSSLQRIIQYLQSNYMRNISIQAMSEDLMLNPNYVSTLINKHCNCGFADLLDHFRLPAACQLMMTEADLSNAEISDMVGYHNERRLYHAFQRRLGLTPGTFRARYGRCL